MIPKIAHVVWNHKEVLNSTHPLIVNGLHNLIKMNPDWKVTVYTPSEIEYDLKNVLSQDDYEMVRNKNFVSKIDLWRLFKMHFEGGLYMDIDRMYNIPLSNIIEDGIKWVCPTIEDYDFSCDFLLSAAKNPVFSKAIELYLTRCRLGLNNQYLLGPQTYTHAVSLIISGKMINTGDGKEAFDFIRNKIDDIPFIKTFREVPFNDMITYKGSDGDLLEEIKRDFYAKEGVKHWTGDW
jgi:hypothetical protein